MGPADVNVFCSFLDASLALSFPRCPQLTASKILL